MSDIGKGDVVVAIRQRLVGPAFTPERRCYVIMPGQRAIVSGFTDPRPNFCDQCGETSGPGLLLEQYPLIEGLSWCHCEWKRFGGSKDDHMAWFKSYTEEKPPVPVLKPGLFRRLGLT